MDWLKHARRLISIAAAVALAAAHTAALIPGFTTTRLWEDEAFNLTVPLNLLAGLGYASDGTLSGSELTPYDARISTGPVMLLPISALIALGVDPVTAGRGTGTLFWIALVVGLWILGRGIAGTAGGLLAAATPLLLDLDDGRSPVQGPNDILGEVPSAALIVWAVVAARRSALFGGLIFGLAVQSKFIALLAAPALVVFVLLRCSPLVRQDATRNVVRAAAGAAIPTVVYEMWKLAALGWDDYVVATLKFGGFLVTGGQDGFDVAAFEKATVLAVSWVLQPAVMAALLIVLLLGVSSAVALIWRKQAFAQSFAERHNLWPPTEVFALTAMAVTGVGTYLGWWVVSSHTPSWIRHPSPGLLAFVPLLVAAAWYGLWVRAARDGDSHRREPPAGARSARSTGAALVTVSVLGLSALAIGLTWGTAYRTWFTQPSHAETLDDQRQTASTVGDVLGFAPLLGPGDTAARGPEDWLAVEWGSGVSVALLAGAHVGLLDAGDSVEAEPWMWTGEPEAPCDELLRVDRYVVCAAR